jgi:peptide/nickel transport system substrate-binding protein
MPGFEEAGGLEGDPDLDYIQDPSGDPELAAEYFRAAGYESGKYEGDDEILIVSENAGVDKRVGEAVNDLFEELGFNVTFREVSADAMLTKFSRPAAEVAVCPTGWLKDFNDPQSMLEPVFDGDEIKPVNNNNWSELDVPEINEAMKEAALITDPDERAQAWGEIDTMLMEQVPAIPYVWDDQANVYSANVNAVMNLANGQTDLSFTSLEGGGS